MTREIETWLSDSRVNKNTVCDLPQKPMTSRNTQTQADWPFTAAAVYKN